MVDAAGLVLKARGKHPVTMADVLAVDPLREGLAPHLRGLTRAESFAEVHHLLDAFLQEIEDVEPSRGVRTTGGGGLDDRQMSIVVARLVTWPPLRSADHPESKYRFLKQRNSEAFGLPGFGGDERESHVRRLTRNSSEFGRAFQREFISWLEDRPAPAVVSLADFVAPSRITHDPAAEAFDGLEVFVDGDETIARLVAGGLHLSQSPSLDASYTRLSELAAEWSDEELSAADSRTYAAVTWLTEMLSGEQRFVFMLFATLPALTLPLDLLADPSATGLDTLGLAGLVSAGLINEVEPERYEMPSRLHRRVSRVVTQILDAEGDRDLREWLLAYYVSRLRDAADSLTLDRLKGSVTRRVQAGYAPNAIARIDPVVAENWYRRERSTVLAVAQWLVPNVPEAWPLAINGQRIERVLATTDLNELTGWIAAQSIDTGFLTDAARSAVAEFDALARETS